MRPLCAINSLGERDDPARPATFTVITHPSRRQRPPLQTGMILLRLSAPFLKAFPRGLNYQGALAVRKKISLEYTALDGLLSRTNVTHFTQEKFSRKWAVLDIYILLDLNKFY